MSIKKMSEQVLNIYLGGTAMNNRIGINGEKILLRAESNTLQYTGVKLASPYHFEIRAGMTYVVIGENGSGKTTLGKILEKGWNIGMNRIVGDKRSLCIKSIEFTDIHSLTGCNDTYYQQRFESTANDCIPTVDELMSGKISESAWLELCRSLSIDDVRHKRVNYLSSGELRKFLIINMLTEKTDLLIIDNPYIGLDAGSRDLFNGLIADLAGRGTAVMLLLCNPIDIPDYTDYVLPMKNLTVGEMIAVKEMGMEQVKLLVGELFDNIKKLNLPETKPKIPVDYHMAFSLDHCNVAYGNNLILHDVSWRVTAGEKWALLGKNGSGKSTLLSLVYADNPQGYCNDITIFDRRRGTGESIWEIKRRIGYVSPEMHLYFNNGETLLSVVASGLHDNIGCFRRIDEEQKATAMQWIVAFGLENLAGRYFNTLSSGEQRLALIARTFARRASLLILDEPLHGLDMVRKSIVARAIEQITANDGVSLVYVTHYEHEIPKVVDDAHIFRLVRP